MARLVALEAPARHSGFVVTVATSSAVIDGEDGEDDGEDADDGNRCGDCCDCSG